MKYFLNIIEKNLSGCKMNVRKRTGMDIERALEK